MSATTLTASQHAAYTFIKHYISTNGYAPTTAEITEGLHLKSRSAVHRTLQAIAKTELISLLPNRRRNICLHKTPENDLLPLVGRIAAGKPIEMIAELDQQKIDVNALLASKKRFLLEVKGDSMIGDNICDGDLVICEKASALKRKGQIAVVIVKNSEATLKRVMREDNKVILIPSNPNLIPMEYAAEDIQIQGFYLGLLRLINLQH